MEKRGLAAFGVVFQLKMCLKHCKIRGFYICRNAKTLYFTSGKAVVLTSLTAK
jgi:hypothetical protein